MLGIKFEIALDMGIATTTPYAVVENDIFGFWFHYIYFIIIYIGVYAMYMCVSWLRCEMKEVELECYVCLCFYGVYDEMIFQ